MAYWLDDGFDTWPEVVRVGKAAAGLYVCCGVWIARGISNGTVTDAVIPVEVATMYGTPEWVAKLVSVGLWRTEEAGYRDVRYHSMGNPTAQKAAEQKAAKKARQERWRAKQGKKTRPETVTRRSGDASHDGSEDDAPSLPPSKEGKGDARPAPRGAARAPQQPPPLAPTATPPDLAGLRRQLSDASRTVRARANGHAGAFERLREAVPDPTPPEPPSETENP